MKRAAIFDMDGTLIRGTSAERLFLPYLQRRGMLGLSQWLPFLGRVILIPFVGHTSALRRNKAYLAGLSVKDVGEATTRFVEEELEDHLCRPVVRRLEELARNDVAVFLLTGAPDFLAGEVGRHFGMMEAIGTRLEIRGPRYTGRLGGIHYFGSAKADAVQELARRHDLDLTLSWGFADHVHDIPFLECFGCPVAVEPRKGLRRHAQRNGWEIVDCRD